MDDKENNKKDIAKEKIILFVIGVLVGAVISTAAFLIYTKTLGTSSDASGSTTMQMPSGTPPEMPSGEGGQNSQGGTPPEKPASENTSQDDNS